MLAGFTCFREKYIILDAIRALIIADGETRNFSRMTEGKRPFGKPRRRREVGIIIIQTDFEETGCEKLDRIRLRCEFLKKLSVFWVESRAGFCR